MTQNYLKKRKKIKSIKFGNNKVIFEYPKEVPLPAANKQSKNKFVDFDSNEVIPDRNEKKRKKKGKNKSLMF